MALFSSMADAEKRALQKGPSGDNTWVEAFACRDDRGQPAVRVLRKMTATGGGEWITLTDNAAV